MQNQTLANEYHWRLDRPSIHKAIQGHCFSCWQCIDWLLWRPSSISSTLGYLEAIRTTQKVQDSHRCLVDFSGCLNNGYLRVQTCLGHNWSSVKLRISQRRYAIGPVLATKFPRQYRSGCRKEYYSGRGTTTGVVSERGYGHWGSESQ